MLKFASQRKRRPGRRTVTAYCTECDPRREWEGQNVQGTAARHTDATGHRTIVEVVQCHVYFVPEAE